LGCDVAGLGRDLASLGRGLGRFGCVTWADLECDFGRYGARLGPEFRLRSAQGQQA